LIEAWSRADAAGLKVVVQEFVPGDDSHGANYNAYFWDGRPVVEFTAQKLRLSPPRIPGDVPRHRRLDRGPKRALAPQPSIRVEAAADDRDDQETECGG
jgi:hypothetical protein